MRNRNTSSRKALAAVVAEQDNGRKVVAMSRELSTYEAMGGAYTEVDGILYPNIGMDDTDTKSDMVSIVTAADIGKYGHLWIFYLKENHPDRYCHHIRMGQLYIKVKEVNEEAYKMLDMVVEKYLARGTKR